MADITITPLNWTDLAKHRCELWELRLGDGCLLSPKTQTEVQELMDIYAKTFQTEKENQNDGK